MSASLPPSNNLGAYEIFICVFKEHNSILSEGPVENNHNHTSSTGLIYYLQFVWLHMDSFVDLNHVNSH